MRKMPDHEEKLLLPTTIFHHQNKQNNQCTDSCDGNSCYWSNGDRSNTLGLRGSCRDERSPRHRSQLWRSRITRWYRGNLLILFTATVATTLTVLASERKLQMPGRVIFKILHGESIHSGTSALQIRCTHHDEFLYASPASKCTSYYRCYQGEQIRYRCNERSVFDFYQQKCIRSEGTCYEPVCTGKTNGLYADTTHSCRRSYECSGGKLIAVANCPLGHLFDGNKCAPQHEVTCESPKNSAIAFPFSGDDRCFGRQNGNHIIDDEQCKKFMICHENTVIDVLECPFGYVYNEVTRRCTYTGGIGMVGCMSNFMDEGDDMCSKLPDGPHTDPTSKDCKKYIECMDGRLFSKHECPRATVFNGVQCVPDVLYHCPRIALPGDICDKKHDGFYIDPRKGCSYYVRCERQRTVENHSCPSGFHYNPSENLCLEQLNSEVCRESGYSNDCIQRSAGYYQDTSEEPKCSQYFYCFNGNKTTLRCGPGHVYDGENCVSSSVYTCPSTNFNSCISKPNGYYRDPAGGCRSYFYCSEGIKTSYLCNPGQIFSNGHCVGRLEDTSCNDDAVCVGKSDGYYQDFQSNCRNYFYCQRGEKLQTLTCRGSKIFNGHSCVPQDTYICPRGKMAADTLLNCLPRPCSPDCSRNGFQNDFDSDCENYFFCIDGKKTVLSCSNNYVFNGEICVPRDTYQCPKYCESTASCK
ncbi:uncharacterized protein LOC5569084 isoform X1 [Aedes aegypti]|uniref:Chitin-binding type-2 domain-containing protein n=1 Tax=Aedes aegypti TaxID=7159 RepID=A0A1S4EY45_AEDAE|nr:uncharacterized protein LOC5569084 isoform X1 [Aedes aegypti]